MEPKITEQTADFRTYEPEWVDSRFGSVLLQLCENRDPESDRWEPFVTTLAWTDDRDRQEARHGPKETS